MTLPTITLTLRERDPEWKAIFVDGKNHAVNMDTYQKDFEIEVEVVQLNLNSGGMRVRYEWPDKHTKKGFSVVSRDVPIEHFYKQYQITKI